MNARAAWKTWGGRAAVLVAALATIATSPLRWGISATPPPAAPVPASSATLVTIEASELPSVTIRRGAGGELRPLPPYDVPYTAPAWPGRAQYLVPPGDTLEGAAVDGIFQNQGMCAPQCAPPASAFVRITRVEAVAQWRLDAESPPQTLTIGPQHGVSFVVTLEATRAVEMSATASGAPADMALLLPASAYVEPSAEHGADPHSRTGSVEWQMTYEAPQDMAPRTYTWTVHATIRGFCRDTTECTPPAGESVRVVSVAPRPSP